MSTPAPDFSGLESFIAAWGLEHWEDRAAKRAETPLGELRAFHQAMVPRLEEIIAFLNQWPLEDIPFEHRPLSWAALAVCEVDASVEIWDATLLDTACDPREFTAKTDYYDTELPVEPKRGFNDRAP